MLDARTLTTASKQHLGNYDSSGWGGGLGGGVKGCINYGYLLKFSKVTRSPNLST